MQMTISNSGIDIYLITDVSCILLLLHVLQKLKISVGSEDEIKFFRKMILSFFVYVLMDALMVFFMESLAVFPPAACCVISALDEISLAAVGLYWFLFGTTRLGYACSDSVRFRMLAAIPFAAVVVFSVTSPFTGLLFRISPEGVYSRGPLFAVQAGITFLYNLSVPVLAVIRSARTKSPSERDKAISLIKFVVAPLCSGIIQWINPNTPILCLGLVLGIYYVFIDILDMQIFNDALTGLNNRRRAERYLTECIDMVSAEKHLYVSMIDVDHFKCINDRYGHAEGDRALKLMADALKVTADRYHDFSARMGGDEFLFSVLRQPGMDADDVTQTLRQELDRLTAAAGVPYRIGFSIGCAECSSASDSLAALTKEADSRQYVMKRHHHEETGS